MKCRRGIWKKGLFLKTGNILSPNKWLSIQISIYRERTSSYFLIGKKPKVFCKVFCPSPQKTEVWEKPRTLGGDSCCGTQRLYLFVPAITNGGGFFPHKCPCYPWGICIIHPTLRVEKCPCLRNKRQSYWGISLGCILKILLGSTLLNSSRHYRSVCYPSLREFSWPAWTAVKFSSRKFMASPGKQYVTFEIHSAWVGEGHAAVEPLKRAQAAHRLVWSTDNIDFSSSIVLQSVALQRRKLLRWSQ